MFLVLISSVILSLSLPFPVSLSRHPLFASNSLLFCHLLFFYHLIFFSSCPPLSASFVFAPLLFLLLFSLSGLCMASEKQPTSDTPPLGAGAVLHGFNRLSVNLAQADEAGVPTSDRLARFDIIARTIEQIKAITIHEVVLHARAQQLKPQYQNLLNALEVRHC